MFSKKTIFLFSIYIILGIFIILLSLQRFITGQIFYFDFGIFSHILFQASRFQLPFFNHVVLGTIFFLGDHFQPSLLLLTPLYWITSSPIILAIEQGIVIFMSIFVMYVISIKNKLNTFFSVIITILFISFAGTLNPLLTDWHPESTAGFVLLLFIYFVLFTKNKFIYVLLAIIFLGFKESNGIYLLLVNMWLYLQTKNKYMLKIGIISIIWVFVSIKYLIPMISGKFYLYTPEISFNPAFIIQNVINDPLKISFIKNSMLSYGLLPFLSGFASIPILGDLLLKTVPTKTLFANFTFTFHYHVYLGIFLSIASIYAIVYLQKKLKQKWIVYIIVVFVLCVSLLTARKITQSPINLLINTTFWSQSNISKAHIFQLINTIPDKGSVMGTNNILAYVSNRTDELFLLKLNYEKYNPDIIAFDVSKEQNINNYWESNWDKIDRIIKKIGNDKKYKRVILNNKNYYLFIKK